MRKPKADKGVKGSVGAPMPGKVISIRKEVGDRVMKGDTIVVLSAMKMETNVTTPIDGIVSSISVTPDTTVSGGDLLITIEP